LTEALLRFSSGLAGSLLVGLAVFRSAVFRSEHPAFECLTVGALAAGILALARQRQRGAALGLALAYGCLQPLVPPGPVRLQAAASALLFGLGLFLVALIFDLLAQAGWRFGKFLIVGPLAGGVFLALSPLTELAGMNVANASRLMLFRLSLGVLIGEGVALGVELVEWPLEARSRAAHAAGLPVVQVARSDSDGT